VGLLRRLFSTGVLARADVGPRKTLHPGLNAGFGRRAKRVWAGVAAGVGVLAAASGPLAGPAPLGLINITPSEPPGLYARTQWTPALDRLIAFVPPRAAGQVGDGRLARLHSFLKRVAAVDGDQVCSDGRVTRINGVFAGDVAQVDSLGRALPHWIGCRRLARNEVFVLSNRVANSFDSRYFGPVQLSAVIGVYRPIWTAR
jgi:conjugative transfer signal peptidase TraF